MKYGRIALLAVIVGTLPLVGCAGDSSATSDAADNTGRNVRDRADNAVTSGDQSESEGDRTLTQRIRQAVVADDALSVTAKNIKIITASGVVTLRGPVKSEQERSKIVGMATTIAGAGKVQNNLEVVTQ